MTESRNATTGYIDTLNVLVLTKGSEDPSPKRFEKQMTEHGIAGPVKSGILIKLAEPAPIFMTGQHPAVVHPAQFYAAYDDLDRHGGVFDVATQLWKTPEADANSMPVLNDLDLSSKIPAIRLEPSDEGSRDRPLLHFGVSDYRPPSS